MSMIENCPVCGASTGPTKSDIIDHLEDEHGITDDISIRYNTPGKLCALCGEDYDMTYKEYIDHLKEEHRIEEEDIFINVPDAEEQPVGVQGQTTVVDIVERNVQETKEFLEDWRDEHYSQSKRRLWIRGALVGGVIFGVLLLSYVQILSGDTITSLVSVIVGYLLAEQRL
jgi:predicted small metal-binding protein